jgi:hypothetical protein
MGEESDERTEVADNDELIFEAGARDFSCCGAALER